MRQRPAVGGCDLLPVGQTQQEARRLELDYHCSEVGLQLYAPMLGRIQQDNVAGLKLERLLGTEHLTSATEQGEHHNGALQGLIRLATERRKALRCPADLREHRVAGGNRQARMATDIWPHGWARMARQTQPGEDIVPGWLAQFGRNGTGRKALQIRHDSDVLPNTEDICV